MGLANQNKLCVTCVDEASRRSFTELFGFVRQRDLDDPGDVARRSLDSDGVRGDQLGERNTANCINTIVLLLLSLIVEVCVTSLHTSMVPKTTCRPSKKLSPIRMTVAPPVVQPSLGLMALIHGVAAGPETQGESQTGVL